jgi:peptidylprolyl isomerase
MNLIFIPSLLVFAFAMQRGQEPPVPPDVAAAPKDAQITASGLASKVLTKGTGTAHPTLESEVTVHYSGWTTDGKMFDSSVQRGEPATFPLNRVIKGWQEGVQLMVVGEKRRFWIPGALAYDNSTRAGVPKGTLVFDVELLSIK